MFQEILNDVEEYLKIDARNDDDRGFTFLKHSHHMRRVFVWVQRLMEDCTEDINRNAVLIAALFHDIGRHISHEDHPNQSAIIFRDYAIKKQYDEHEIEFIEYLIRNHSNKEELFLAETPLELVFLMEADMLDDTGALGIIRNAMVSGIQSAQNYVEAYNLLSSWACSTEFLTTNPMRTAKAREIWESKQRLNSEFIQHLKYDLAIDE